MLFELFQCLSYASKCLLCVSVFIYASKCLLCVSVFFYASECLLCVSVFIVCFKMFIVCFSVDRMLQSVYCVFQCLAYASKCLLCISVFIYASKCLLCVSIFIVCFKVFIVCFSVYRVLESLLHLQPVPGVRRGSQHDGDDQVVHFHPEHGAAQLRCQSSHLRHLQHPNM